MFESLFVSPWYWVIAGVVLAGLEIAAPGVYLLWIGLGAIVVGLALWLLPDFGVSGQMLLFAVAMIASTGLGFVIQRKGAPRPGEPELNQELLALVGRRFVALDDFSAGRGRVRVGDGSYSASCEDPVAKGETVEVSAIDHGILKVVRRPVSQ